MSAAPPDGADRDLVGSYQRRTHVGRRDEMVDEAQRVRPSWRDVGRVINELGPEGLRNRGAAIKRLLQDDGVEYRPPDSEVERWSLDPLPMLIDEQEWTGLLRGLRQRAELLDLILADCYGPRRLIEQGALPAPVVFAHEGFVRQVDGIRLPGPHQLFLHSCDLARDSDGGWRVMGDRTQAPSGAGYAMENRTVLSRVLPGLYQNTGIHRIAPFFHTLRRSLQRLGTEISAASKSRVSRPPRVVLMSPGPHSETAFDQAFLSSLLGFPFTTADDLVVRDGRVWQRSLRNALPVDVILRRVDSWFCDPLDLRPESLIGVPGLIDAERRGTVAVVNGLGSGVLENPALQVFLPGLCRLLLAADLQLPSVQGWWCGDPVSRRHVLARLPDLVIRPLSRGAGRNSIVGASLSSGQRAELAARIEAEPFAWVGQSQLPLSTAPTVDGSGLGPRPVTLRTFAVSDGTRYELMRGGLTRVGGRAEDMVVSNAVGAISKDVWILSRQGRVGAETSVPGMVGPETVSAAVSPRIAEDLYWLGRYTERAESAARQLRVVGNRRRDLHPSPDRTLARCVAVLERELSAADCTFPALGTDLARVRELAAAVRDQLSPDTWTLLGHVERSMSYIAADQAGPPGGPGPAVALDEILQAMLAFSGLIADSMVRDSGWFLLDAGRRIERAQQVVALIGRTLVDQEPDAVETLLIESSLTVAESIITHRRRYPAFAGVETVLELLLSDGGNPRSVQFQLNSVADDLTNAGGEGAGQDRIADGLGELARLLDSRGQINTTAVAQGRRRELDSFLRKLGTCLRDLHDAVADNYFAAPARLRPLAGFQDPEPTDR